MGKPTERQEISGEDGDPLKIKVVYEDLLNREEDVTPDDDVGIDSIPPEDSQPAP
jgi:hypothetical protein